MLIHVAPKPFIHDSKFLLNCRVPQPLHDEDRAEACHDVVFRAIKETCHPHTFIQLTKCTHEWWDSNVHEPFKNLDQYLAVRRVNIAMVSELLISSLLPRVWLTFAAAGLVLRQW